MDNKKLIKIYEKQGCDQVIWEVLYGRVDLKQINNAFRHATSEGHLDLASKLFPFADSTNRSMGLRDAGAHGHSDILSLLISKQHEDQESKPFSAQAFQTAIEHASHSGQWDCIMMLIDAAPQGDYFSALQYLIRHNNKHKSVELLLNKSTLPNPEHLLTYSAQFSTPEVCALLLPLCSNDDENAKCQAFQMALVAKNKETGLFLLDAQTLEYAKMIQSHQHFLLVSQQQDFDQSLAFYEAHWTNRVLNEQVTGGKTPATRKM